MDTDAEAAMMEERWDGPQHEFGGMPHDAILRKLEETDPVAVDAAAGHVPLSDDPAKDYIRGELVDWRPDAPYLESDAPRRGTNRFDFFMQHRYGHEEGGDDYPKHPELFMQFTDPDPRGTRLDPRFDQWAAQYRARTPAITARMLPGAGDQTEFQSPWTGQAISYAFKEVMKRQRILTHVFHAQRRNFVSGGLAAGGPTAMRSRRLPDTIDTTPGAAAGQTGPLDLTQELAPTAGARRSAQPWWHAILPDAELGIERYTAGPPGGVAPGRHRPRRGIQGTALGQSLAASPQSRRAVADVARVTRHGQATAPHGESALAAAPLVVAPGPEASRVVDATTHGIAAASETSVTVRVAEAPGQPVAAGAGIELTITRAAAAEDTTTVAASRTAPGPPAPAGAGVDHTLTRAAAAEDTAASVAVRQAPGRHVSEVRDIGATLPRSAPDLEVQTYGTAAACPPRARRATHGGPWGPQAVASVAQRAALGAWRSHTDDPAREEQVAAVPQFGATGTGGKRMGRHRLRADRAPDNAPETVGDGRADDLAPEVRS